MLRESVNEIRFHPGPFVATLLAIAISVGFIAAISTTVNTESRAVARSAALPISKADIVVEGYPDTETNIVDLLDGVPGVAAAGSANQAADLLTAGEQTAFVTFIQLPLEQFRWATLDEGRWPAGADELALSRDGANQLGVGLGDELHLGGESGPPLRLVGITDDARSLFTVTAYLSGGPVDIDDTYGTFVVATEPGASALEVIAAIKQVVPAGMEVTGGDQAREEQLTAMTGGTDVFKYLLYAFAGIALVVGMIIISNTFTILVTQRRRQIGLLRAVGASTGQVRGRLVVEALLLGLIGSLIGVALGIGVAAIVGLFTGSLFWGLVLRPAELAFAAAVGVVATLLSMLGPSLAATKVKPLEALQPVPSARQAKEAGTLRLVVCILFAAVGVAALVQSRTDPELSLVWAMLAGALLSVAILAASPLYVAPLLRLLGRIFRFTGPTARLAAENAARNPRRASATVVALMLAVGLVVTLQVAVATLRTTGMAAIDERFPTDLVVTADAGTIDADLVTKVQGLDGVRAAVSIPSKEVDVGGYQLWVRDVNPARAELGLPGRLDVPDGVIRVSDFGPALPAEVTLATDDGPLTLRVEREAGLDSSYAAVSQDTFAQLPGPGATSEVWIKLVDRTDTPSVNNVVETIQRSDDGLWVDGSAVLAGVLEQVLDVILLVLTGLLGVAVLIALVGVGNTLGLSVIERQRESALLRALGMQRSGLRLMLLAEAMLLAVVGVVIGILAGAFFGWLGVSSAVLMLGDIDLPVYFGIDWGITLLLVAVCVAAAALASVLPGRRAANATPTEALAVE